MANLPDLGAPTYQSGRQSVAPSNVSSPDHARAAALQFLARLAAEVSSGTVDLPCFPNVVIRVRDELANPETSPERTVMIVGAEPRLTARLLQTANSAAFNASGKVVTDLKVAIVRLGHQLVQSAAMAFAVQQLKSEKSLRSIALPLGELWKDSVAVASICHVMARRSKQSPDVAFLTGLLHGIGRMYIMVRSVEKSSELGDLESFMDVVGSWHASIGQSVLANWGLAQAVCEAVGAQDDFERDRKRNHDVDLTDILIAAVMLARLINTPGPHTVQVEGTMFAAIGLTSEDCAAILTHAEYQLGSVQDALGC